MSERARDPRTGQFISSRENTKGPSTEPSAASSEDPVAISLPGEFLEEEEPEESEQESRIEVSEAAEQGNSSEQEQTEQGSWIKASRETERGNPGGSEEYRIELSEATELGEPDVPDVPGKETPEGDRDPSEQLQAELAVKMAGTSGNGQGGQEG
ncbi:uncharacterized protein ATNIH1004_002092 [Aspergillus tanneri]|uniref:Uncharacterized protein n=1 Tax=Aspergillus tanneri TaxID=1220188 RepID=A0A5M9MQM7_9EURO|nr:uncharacterized protein ATNIH1004_002092 [Aspergillus tanneri]KAA8649421.1 hypothetical protein ATNIH1004_002092 [Aspergillus tanneri]